MYTILVNDDNTLSRTVKERIVERSSLVDKLCFLVPQTCNDFDMTEFTCLMEYMLPISKKYKSEILIAEEELYKDKYIKYILPFDTSLTDERGDIDVQLTFSKPDLTEDGEGLSIVRKTSATTIKIYPIATWSDIVG